MKENEGDFSIGGIPRRKILELASQAVIASVKVPGNEAPDRRGGYLVISNVCNGVPLLIERIEECKIKDVLKYHELALEKSGRLCVEKFSGHISSHQSRNPQFNPYGKWGGAIIAGNFIVSFSGLKELFDEAVVLVLALRLGWIDSNRLTEITDISGNTFVKPLYNMAYPKIIRAEVIEWRGETVKLE